MFDWKSIFILSVYFLIQLLLFLILTVSVQLQIMQWLRQISLWCVLQHPPRYLGTEDAKTMKMLETFLKEEKNSESLDKMCISVI